MPSVEEILQFFIIFFNSGWFLVLQIISGIISLILLIAIISLIKRAGYPQRHMRHLLLAWRSGEMPKNRLIEKWENIEQSLKGDDPKLWRAAIVDADKILDEALSKIGYEGSNLDERLSNVDVEQFPSLVDAWRVHQVRQFVEEDQEYLPTRQVVEKTFLIYRNIFKEIGIIL